VGSELPRDIARDVATQSGDQKSRQEVLRDQRVKDALFRFVDEAIMRPSAMQRPDWGNDPNWGVFFHLKAFMYTYHERHLRRALGKLGEGDAAPLALMASFPAMMIGVDLFRDVVQYGPAGDRRKDHWGLAEYAMDGVHRSGVLGVGNILLDMEQAKDFGNPRWMEMAGPTVGQVDALWSAVESGKLQRVQDESFDALPLQNAMDAVSNWGAMMEPTELTDMPLPDAVRADALRRAAFFGSPLNSLDR